MASKRAQRRRLRARQCGGKQRHATARDARKAMRGVQRRHAEDWNLRVYRCRWCGGWHYGHFAP